MKLEIRQVEDLPRLIWCLQLVAGSSTAHVRCGPWVETGEDWFVEGAWNGDFEKREFDRSHGLMGSGCKVKGEELVFATPCHILESLFLVHRDETVTVSNSLAFLLVASGLNLDPRYPYYRVDLISTQRGFDRCVNQIPTENGPKVRLLHYTNIHLNAAPQVTINSKPIPPDFADYRALEAFLVDTLSSLRDNAISPQRHVRYELTSTVSSGYDSASAAALAAQVGGQHAVTVSIGGHRINHDAVNDSGTNVAAQLGLHTVEVDLTDFQGPSEASRAEFAACGDVVELNLVLLEQYLSGTLLTTGHVGSYWRMETVPSSNFAFSGADGRAYQELRLRLGFVHVPVPMLVGVRGPRVHAISHSEEMKPWSLSKKYNRPIPRRILEERGVPRGQFALRPVGGMIQPTTDLPNGLLTYYREHRSRCSKVSRVRLAIRCHVTDLCARAIALARRYRLIRTPRIVHWDVPRLGPNSMIVQWGQSIVQQRYRF